MARVRECGAGVIRFGINWGEVQRDGPASFDWSLYDPLCRQAITAGIVVLPTLYGCPDWASPQVTAEPWSGHEPELPGEHFRTCSPEHDADFGRFADRTLRHLDAAGPRTGEHPVVAGIEILNEPNLWTFGAVPAYRARELTGAAAAAVAAAESAGAYSHRMRVISGGLAPAAAVQPGNPNGYPPRPAWQEYLAELAGGPDPGFDVGFHSYETGKPPDGVLSIPEDDPADPLGRADEFAGWQAGSILDKLDEALSLTDADVWLTETGASSASPWPEDIFSPGYRELAGEQIQAEVLSRVADGLRSRPRCRSMIVHRLYSNDDAEPPPAADDSPHYQYGVYDSIDGRPKLAVPALAAAWD